MLEDTTIPCPKCDKELHVKVLTSSRKPVYVVGEDCSNCKTKSGKIERLLNSSGKSSIRYEKGYLKTDPRG